MLALVPWLVFLHTFSALLFFLAHGTSVAMTFQIRKEKDFARIGAMLDLSATTMGVTFFSCHGSDGTGHAVHPSNLESRLGSYFDYFDAHRLFPHDDDER